MVYIMPKYSNDLRAMHNEKMFQSEKLINHFQEQINDTQINLVHDISLVKLKESLPLDDGRFTAIRIVEDCDRWETRLRENTMTMVAGWGRTEKVTKNSPNFMLKKATANYTTNKQQTCRSVYGKNFLPPYMFCAGGASGDSCNGDSGGPYVMRENDDELLIGLVSWGPKTCGE